MIMVMIMMMLILMMIMIMMIPIMIRISIITIMIIPKSPLSPLLFSSLSPLFLPIPLAPSPSIPF